MVGFRDGLVARISEEDSMALEVLPSVEEISETVWNCESSKASGSDGYNMNFIEKCWDEIGTEFMPVVTAFFQTSKLPKDSIITWVTLAPKFIRAKEIKDLCPISMVGCVYKVISNVLVRRMREMILGLVGETLSAFVNGCKINDGALIAYRSAEDGVWVKMEGVGYGVYWYNLDVSIDIWLTTTPFIIERGLRQADPLLLVLFVLVVDVLHRMVGEVVRNGRISPFFIGRDNIELLHLQFADDSILLECKKATLPIKYLEISLGANPWLVKTWKPIIDKVEEKLSSWKSKVLNKAEKLVLIKTILNSLPVYYLSLYKMPKAVAEKLISLQKKILWSKEDGRNGIALVRWEVVQAPKKLGGLGVGDAMIRNTALLFKWLWRFSKEECPL
ncbi:uncharacterized protein LOC130950385 [Arachis stenosperma]|uniref:uncharacterized protein LOC130950385 n=1 Tax=Arachis stenosperma TaxID=217475 RepID=UPI0025ACFB2E|nr:uncharacterized protein LOC130950385 [Arachis stenosperma]